MKNTDILSTTVFKLINDKKMHTDRYLITDNVFLYKIEREDEKLLHAVVVAFILSKYVLHQVHDALGHNCTARTYQYVK